jgi:hypothetical protein
MRYIVTNTMLNLCNDRLQEVERLETTLAEDKIVYRGSVKDVGPSTSISSPSMSYRGLSTSWNDIGHP